MTTGGWGPEQERYFRGVRLGEPTRLDGPVLLAGYDREWPLLYEREAVRIRSALGDRVLLLEHVGSTAVPGLSAKPIIDILLVVADTADEQAYVPDLERAGYRLWIREPDWHQHRLLTRHQRGATAPTPTRGRRKRSPDTDINLHVHPPDSPEIDRHLQFRDHLRSDAADRELYERTKRELAARNWTYTQQYADAKSQVVEEILERSTAR